MEIVKVRDEGSIRYLELNDGIKKNSLDLEMAQSLLKAIKLADEKADCKVIVFSSTGRAHFSKGPDLDQLINLAEKNNEQAKLDQVVSILNQVILEIYQTSKITIAAIHGYAYGGGLNIMLACDYRLTVNNAKFIESFLYMGVTPDLSASYFLPRLIGMPKTLEILLTGRLFTGQEAAEWGIFQESFSKRSEMMERVKQLGEQFNTLYLENISKMKELLRVTYFQSLEQQLELEKQLLLEAFQHPAIKSSLMNVHTNNRIM
ncbi:enoyl-CoA hydratase/isomerase family protein [Metabacillus fastidiosus]|uniref:enoyl-CoA hydratase/isomerase family protein n=1 Tax=Metabacillus fastidiosus TaxID=1458 RepID=UPI003D26BF53